MRQVVANRGRLAKGMFRPLVAEKKKVVAASCLVVVMAIMWIRVLTNKAPETAEAALVVEQLNVEDTTAKKLNVSYIRLPQVVGRNDVITRDFFASNDWRHFGSKQKRNLAVIEEVNVVSKNGNDEVIRKVAEKLKLEAIVVLSNKPRAFINNKVISVGEKVLIRDGNDTYECEVIDIKENIVVIKCREAEITLKLTQTLMVEN
jgi:hypothetical protein